MKKLPDKEYIDTTLYTRLVRLWLVAMLLVLPFQFNISRYIAHWSSKASTVINNLDELTIVIFLLLSAREFYRLKKLSGRIFFFYFHH